MTLAALPFKEIWCVDFEYQAAPGERPAPLCMCALELRSGRELRLWRPELFASRRAPFDTGPNAVLIAYAAAAETSCFLELGWPLPHNIIDLFAEHRVATNGVPLAVGNGLLGALAIRGLAHIDAGDKADMRRLILNQTTWSEAEQKAILDYCWTDVAALAALLPAMSINLPFTLLRGQYGSAVARMERAGVPIDVGLYRRVLGNWDGLKRDLIVDVDQAWDVYDDGHFRMARFERRLTALGIAHAWPRTETGLLATDDDTFLEQAALHLEFPQLQMLRELRATLSRMQLIGLEIGNDGRNRCALMPYQAITGRNLPSNAKFIFGPARWLRGFIAPPPGYGLAYLDFASEEIAIAAALASDEILAEHYATGDPYLRFAIAAGLAPPDATKDSHGAVRDACKSLFLGIGYGMQAPSLAAKAGITQAAAAELIALHRETYRHFTRWRMDTVDRALLSGRMRTPFDWRRRGCETARATELMNWPIQSLGSDLMRAVCIAATEAGIEVACPVHDAFLTVSPLQSLDRDVAYMREIMHRASEVATGGLRIRVDVKVVRDGRYMDSRGRGMWDRVMEQLRRREAKAAA
jgi:DNA polymerase I